MSPDIANQRMETLKNLNILQQEKILDIGCGTGFLSFELALLTGQQGSVVAMDLQQAMVEAAAERCASLPQVSTQQGRVEELPFADESFDVVTCTQVLLYVEAVDTALSEMHRVLKPGGRIAVLETDWHGAVMNSQYPDITDRIISAWDQAVASPNLPRVLPSKLKHLGFTAVLPKAIPILNNSYSEGNFSVSSLDWLRKSAVKAGAITEAESTKWKQDLDRLGQAGEYFFCVNRFLFTAVKC